MYVISQNYVILVILIPCNCNGNGSPWLIYYPSHCYLEKAAWGLFCILTWKLSIQRLGSNEACALKILRTIFGFIAGQLWINTVLYKAISASHTATLICHECLPLKSISTLTSLAYDSQPLLLAVSTQWPLPWQLDDVLRPSHCSIHAKQEIKVRQKTRKRYESWEKKIQAAVHAADKMAPLCVSWSCMSWHTWFVWTCIYMDFLQALTLDAC